MNARRGLTMIDLLVTLAVMSIILFIAIPSLGSTSRTRALAAANLFIADVYNARTLSVQNPSNPVRVVISAEGAGYFLAQSDEPETPIEMPTGVGGDYAIVFGEGDHTTLEGVVITPEGVDKDDIEDGSLPEIVFDAFGRLTPSVDQRIVLTADETDSVTIVIRADTGDAYIE